MRFKRAHTHWDTIGVYGSWDGFAGECLAHDYFIDYASLKILVLMFCITASLFGDMDWGCIDIRGSERWNGFVPCMISST